MDGPIPSIEIPNTPSERAVECAGVRHRLNIYFLHSNTTLYYSWTTGYAVAYQTYLVGPHAHAPHYHNANQYIGIRCII
jgi:hypothetical protein